MSLDLNLDHKVDPLVQYGYIHIMFNIYKGYVDAFTAKQRARRSV
jgi:hypothetical protein